MTQRIAIISARRGWHAKQLRAAIEKQGCAVRFAALQQCAFRLGDSDCDLILPGFEEGLPDGVFVRNVPGGTLQEIVFWLDILHALRELGVPVYNDARMIERSVDKAMTSFLLLHAGIPTPPCWVFSDPAQAQALVKRECDRGHQLVFKPLFGSQGKGLKRIDQPAGLPDTADTGGIYYLQRFIECGGDHRFDWRVFVIGGRAVAAMQRNSVDWVTNIANGAECRPAVLNKRLATLAERAVGRLDMHYGGVDILRDTEGKHWVLEVNSIPAWRGLQGVCRFSIAERLAANFLGLCRSTKRMQVIG